MNHASQDVFVLGISAFYHDSAACLIKNGDIIAAAQEERFSRRKHDPDFPINAIYYCLKEASISINEVTSIAYYEKPFVKFERLMMTYLASAPKGLFSFLKAMPLWLHQKLFLKDYMARQLKFKGQILFTEHHEAHAASAFFPSPFRESAIITLDGVGEWTTTSVGVGHDNHLELQDEIRFPHSLGLLYSAFTYYIGFRVNSGEYKLMGLAPYGKPKYVDIIKHELIDIKDDGSFRLNMKYFDYCSGLRMIHRRFEALFGQQSRKPETNIDSFYMDIASSIQAVTQEVMIKIAARVYEKTKLKNLCLAGGVALNCVGNGKILRETPFDKIWIQPAAGDAGGALGAALSIWHQYYQRPRICDDTNDRQKGSYLGPAYTKDDIESVLKQCNAVYHFDPEHLTQRVASYIAEQKVVGFFQGRMEFGPRALGARSILGDARSKDMQRILNEKIKFRESFRPFAPCILEERAGDYFDLSQESPYMLLTADVQLTQRQDVDNKGEGLEQLFNIRSMIPAVTHVDYSARVQTITRAHHPKFYDMIKAFERLTECPVIVNTSFNVRGEPIVNTPLEAFHCFMSTDMDVLVLEDFILIKEEQSDHTSWKHKRGAQLVD